MDRLQRLPKDLLIVITDARRALLLQNTGSEIHPSLEVLDRIEAEVEPGEHEDSDRSGRRYDGGGTVARFRGRSAMEQPDPQKLKAAAFADQLTNHLVRLEREGKVRQILLAAPPAFLGALRDAMPPELTRLVVAQIPKHLTEASIDDIKGALVAPW